MEIKERDKFLCVKEVEMDTGFIEYRKGKVYTSENDDCITNDKGNKHHLWSDESELKLHFEKIEETQKGVKQNEGKLNYELDWEFIEAMAERMSENKDKYLPYNWKKEMELEQIRQAMFRHMIEIMKENYKDETVELGHIVAIANNAMILYHHGKKQLK